MGARVAAAFNLALLAVLLVVSLHQPVHAYASWAIPRPVKTSQEKFLHLNFYIHEDLAGPNPSAAVIVPPLRNNSLFGTVVVVDDPITVSPDPKSLVIGRAKGLYVFDGNPEFNTELVLTTVLNKASGFPGSTYSVRGYNAVTGSTQDPPSELSIVGGTGEFRLARGWTNIRIATNADANHGPVINVTAFLFYGGRNVY